MVLLLHNIPCRFFSAFIILLPVSMLMLIVTPFIGVDANDAHRWLEIMGIQFQPSEFGKLACVVFVAFLLSKRGKLTENQIFKYILIGVGLTCVLILPENFSTAFMLFGVCFLMMFIGQLPFGKLAKLAGILMLALVLSWCCLSLRQPLLLSICRIDSLLGRGVWSVSSTGIRIIWMRVVRIR